MPNNLSNLDANQVIRSVYDETSNTLQTSLPSLTTEIELDATDGDSVISHTHNDQQSALLIDNTGTGTVLAEFDITSLKNFNLYTKTATNITGAQVLTFEVSPADSGDVWIATSLTITPSATAGTVVAGTTETDVVARRGRVTTAAAITTGTYDLYAVGQS